MKQLITFKGRGGTFKEGEDASFAIHLNTYVVRLPKNSILATLYKGGCGKFLEKEQLKTLIKLFMSKEFCCEAGKINSKHLLQMTFYKLFEQGMVVIGEGETEEDAKNDILKKCSFRAYFPECVWKDEEKKNFAANPTNQKLYKYVIHPEEMPEVEREVYNLIQKREDIFNNASLEAVHEMWEESYVTLESLKVSFPDYTEKEICDALIFLHENFCITFQEKSPSHKVHGDKLLIYNINMLAECPTMP